MKPFQNFEQKPNTPGRGLALLLIGFLLLLLSTVVELTVKTAALRETLQIGVIVAGVVAIGGLWLKRQTIRKDH